MFDLDNSQVNPLGAQGTAIDHSSVPIEDRKLYMEIWEERTHICQCCGAPLYEPLLFMFHHVLEKRKKAHADHVDYSQFRHCKWNIMLLCWACHTTADNMLSSKVVRNVADYRNRLLIILELDYSYDRDHIWLTNEKLDLTPITSLFGKFNQIKFKQS
jgi:hypothetical protein